MAGEVGVGVGTGAAGGGGVLATPLMALGGEGTALPMVAVVAGGAIAALLATTLLTLRR